MSHWNWRTFGYFRMILGAYLAIHFAGLVPWAAEVFSGNGMMPSALSPLIGMFPNPLGVFEHPWFATGFVVSGVGLSVAFAAGWKDRWVAPVLWFVWACLLGRAPLIANPGIPFVGWLLLWYAAVPRPAAGQLNAWRLPEPFFVLAWALMAVGYSFSGVTKLTSPSWLDGSALMWVLESPLARPHGLRAWLLEHPSVLTVMSYGVLALEVAAAPLATFPRLRPWLWLALVAMHMGILVTIDFADLTIGMLMVHVVTFDPAWLARRGSRAVAEIVA